MDMRENQAELYKKLGVPPGIGPGSPLPGNPAEPKSKTGCLAKLMFIVGLVILALAGIFYLYPLATPDKIRGDIIDCALVAQKDGSNRLWILTDGSFTYISTTKSPGHYSSGRKCKSCKAWLYEYDPVGGKVIRRIKIPYRDIIIRTSLFYKGDKIWHVADAYHLDDPKIQKFDVSIAKNYLTEKEIDFLNRLVSMYLDYAEIQAGNSIPMTMEDWFKRLDEFLKLNDREILKNAGKISHKIAVDKAESEFEKYRITQDQIYLSDFDKYIDELEKIENSEEQ